MDQDNILDASGTVGSDFHITDSMRAFWAESARWAKFIAIVTFVFMGLGVIVMLFTGGTMMAADLPVGSGVFIVFYLIFLGIACIPVYYLYQFATKMQAALRADDQAYLQSAFEYHKSMFKFYGIFLAIMLGIYALVFVIGIFGALLM